MADEITETTNKLQSYVKNFQSIKEDINRLEGRKEALLKQLKTEHNIASINEAETYQKKLEKELEEAKSQLKTKLLELKNTYGIN